MFKTIYNTITHKNAHIGLLITSSILPSSSVKVVFDKYNERNSKPQLHDISKSLSIILFYLFLPAKRGDKYYVCVERF
jgi:hypothetical protein